MVTLPTKQTPKHNKVHFSLSKIGVSDDQKVVLLQMDTEGPDDYLLVAPPPSPLSSLAAVASAFLCRRKRGLMAQAWKCTHLAFYWLEPSHMAKPTK